MMQSAIFRRWASSAFVAWLSHHIFGVGGQIAAAAPVIVITVILSHTTGLESAGHFVIASAVSACLFATSYLGLVYYVSIDRLCRFDARDFMLTRLGATVVATLLLFAVSVRLAIPGPLVILVALLRIADAAVDMAWGLDLLRKETAAAMQRYTLLNGAKLIVIVVPTALAWIFPLAPSMLMIAGATIATGACWAWLGMLSRESGGARQRARGQVARSLRLAAAALWFTVAISINAVITNLPRLIIDRSYAGDALGIAGVTLTFGTLYAMAFMSSWLRWFPRLSAVPEGERRMRGMLLETIALATAVTLGNLTIMPHLVAFLFKFDVHAERDLCRDILLAVTFFWLAINVVNVFKLTRAVWLESATYALAIAIGLSFVALFGRGSVIGFLLVSGTAMLAATVCGLAWLRFGARGKTKGNRAMFLRLSSRPIPRVVRMMTVAREAGFDPLFVGAFREAKLPLKGNWEGLALRRVGRPFPLLNGKKPLLYLSSVFSCNLGFLTELFREKPSVVHGSDFEVMPAAVFYRITHKCRLVYNIHDNLAQRYELPGPVRAVLNLIEGVAVLASDCAIVPERFRRDALPSWCRAKITVIRNLPPDEGPAPPPPFEYSRIRIFYGGWLDWQRGMSALLRLAQDPDIELRVAGEGAPDIVAALRQHPRVTYLGFLDSSGVLEETRRCHVVPVLYDPSRIINRFAASNKLAEALSVGRPVILNEELAIAGDFVRSECLITTPYGAAASAAPRLREFASDFAAYAKVCARARELYEQHYSWPKAKAASVAALVGKLR